MRTGFVLYLGYADESFGPAGYVTDPVRDLSEAWR